MQGWNQHIEWKERPKTRVPIEPGVSADHGDYQEIQSTIDQLSGPYFLFTWVRDPIERCLSEYYHFRVSRSGEKPTDDKIIEFLSSDACRNAAARCLGMPGDMSAETILGRYDMIGVTERFDESVLVLRRTLPMAVNMADILYLKSKDSSAGILDEFGARFHRHIPYAEQSQRVRDFIDSKLRPANTVDYAIWKSANDRLDRHIRVIGLEKMERERTEYKMLLAAARHKCQRYADMVCDCIHTDIGCGKACLSRPGEAVRQNPAYVNQSLSEGSDNVTECHQQDIMDSMARRRKYKCKHCQEERKSGLDGKKNKAKGNATPLSAFHFNSSSTRFEHIWFRRAPKKGKDLTKEERSEREERKRIKKEKRTKRHKERQFLREKKKETKRKTISAAFVLNQTHTR